MGFNFQNWNRSFFFFCEELDSQFDSWFIYLGVELEPELEPERGVCHAVAIAIYIKKYLKAEEELWKLVYFTIQKYNLQEILQKKPKSFKIYYNSMTNLKLLTQAKISSFQNPHIKIGLLLGGKDPLKLILLLKYIQLQDPTYTLLELVSLVKVFRLVGSERTFLGIYSVNTVGRCTTSYLSGRASVFVMPCFEVLCVKEGTFMYVKGRHFAEAIHSWIIRGC
jgi:hypothetical protein